MVFQKYCCRTNFCPVLDNIRKYVFRLLIKSCLIRIKPIVNLLLLSANIYVNVRKFLYCWFYTNC
jgi:hypothetical protein